MSFQSGIHNDGTLDPVSSIKIIANSNEDTSTSIRVSKKPFWQRARLVWQP